MTTAKALAATGSWTFHIIDLNEDIGNKAAAELGNSSRFYKGDVTSYRSIAEIFEAVFKQAKRLDLVFNSAAIVDRTNFYDQGPVDGPPPEFDQKTSDVNYKGTVTVSYLAQHYFRKNPPEVKDTNLVLMASCTGFYPIAAHPIYVSSKRECFQCPQCSSIIHVPAVLRDRRAESHSTPLFYLLICFV